MSRKFTDPTKMPYLNEMYEKEKWLRMDWSHRYFESLEACVLNREPTNYTEEDITKSVMVAQMPSIMRGHIVAAENKKIAPVKDIDLVKLGEKKEIIPAMLPVPEKQKELLYTQSKEEYLKKRHSIPPDKKYNFIECQSWMHGWQFDQSELKLTGSAYGKRFHLSRIKGLSPQPDPPHYLDCKEISELCTDTNR
uniref:Sperm microtubule inner protein 1 C-terminal domain-containing protein n=1 Tax=Heliothis virescens TaxID=7102 RepID=A0A2A4K287_HELVI